MSAIVKTKLKAARDALGKKDYSTARDAAQDVLAYDADNYNATVFLGLALLELGENEKCEEAYLRATKLNPDQALAWQGLVKYYDQKKQWSQYADTLQRLMEVYSKSDDATKCAETLQKLVELRRQRGSRLELVSTLELFLPSSQFHSTFVLLPPPDPTAPTSTTTQYAQTVIHNTLPVLLEIVEILEKDERETVENEVKKARTRLDSASMSPEAVRRSVGIRVWSASKLPNFYNEVISHPNTSDELRRDTEAKLLRYKHQLLCALPSESTNTGSSKKDKGSIEIKRKLLGEVRTMAEGMVLLEIPNEFAWVFIIEGTNVDSIDSYNFDMLRRFVKLFPDSAVASAIKGCFMYRGVSFGPKEDSKDEADEVAEEEDEEMEDVDPFDIILNAVTDLPNSIFAHHVLADTYLQEEDYQNAIATAEKGLVLVRKLEADMGEQLIQIRKAFNIVLATALVHLFPPKHHTRATRVLDDVLSIEPNNARALLARAYILQAACRWSDAADLFSQVADLLEGDISLGLAAKEEHAWCLSEQGENEAAIEELTYVLERLKENDGYEERMARVCWRLGLCHWRLSESQRDISYKYYITALKYMPGFASAFSALGIYYAEAAEPRDPARSARCFQKAFELDASQADAARRLASGFADEREWDLVEAVARRAIAGEGGLGGGLGESEGDKNVTTAAARYKPTNAWAWKALGIVELAQRNYTDAIHSLQVALRADANDANSWQRLGEAYAHAGRHAAALRALDKSLELAPGNWACEFHIAEVQRQTGLLSQAVVAFKKVRQVAPEEALPPVLSSLAETQLALAKQELATGYLARAPETFLDAIASALQLVELGAQYKRSAWKIAADALAGLSEFDTFNDDDEVLGRLVKLIGKRSSERLDGILHYPLIPENRRGDRLDGPIARMILVATCVSRLDLFKESEESAAGAWFDLGVSLAKIGTDLLDDKDRLKAQKEASECIRQALLLQPGNALFWSTYGNLNFNDKPAIAQHAYIRSLEINNKDVAVWVDLGLLYFHNNDNVPANEAFLKAQTLDPDFTLAWVGQGIVAVSNGHLDDAAALFEHAVSLTADLPEADIEYAHQSVIKYQRQSEGTTDALLAPFFALDRYCRRRPSDANALHLLALVCERIRLEEPATIAVKRAIEILEAAYETTEDPILERRYAIAHTTLGRLYLCQRRYTDAFDAFETASGLLPEETTSEEDVSEWTSVDVLRTLCHLGMAIAKKQSGSLEEAVEFAEHAQQASKGNVIVHGQVTVVLAQILWERGGDELREYAKEQLFDSISHNSENLTEVIALAAMGLLTADESLIEAALSEITNRPIDVRHWRDPKREVVDLLADHHLAKGEVERSASILQGAIHVEPTQLRPRSKLAALAFAQGRPELAQSLLGFLLDSAEKYSVEGAAESIRLLALSMASLSTKATVDVDGLQLAVSTVQKAVMLAPWDKKNIVGLRYILSLSANLGIKTR